MKAKLFFYILCGSLVVILAVCGSAFVWGRDQLKTQKDRGLKKQLELQDEQKRTNQLVKLNSRYNDAKARLDDINTALPRSAEQAGILLAVKQAANESQIKLPSIAFTGSAQLTNPQLNQSTVLKGLYVVPISLKLSGNYLQLQDFLSRLERLSRYNSVVSLATTKVNTDPDKLEVSMTMNAYLKP